MNASPFTSRAARIAALLALPFVAVACMAAKQPSTGRNPTDTEWPGYNGGYDATRYSPLKQINTANVASLQEVGRFEIPETLSFQCGPVVIGTRCMSPP